MGRGTVAMSPSFDRAFESYRKWIGWHKPVPAASGRGRGRPRKTQRIVIASDFHVPHHLDEAVRALIHNEAATADLLVIAGDFMDLGSVSRWPKLTKPVPLVEEFQAAQKVMATLASAFRRIVVVPGNHDKRLLKRLADGGVPEAVLDYYRAFVPDAVDPLALVVAGLKNVEMAPHIVCGDARYDFVWQHGDLVVGHPESYSRIPARGAGLFSDWVMKTAIPAGIINAPVRLILQGHSHGAGLVWSDYGVWVGETGCMCRMGDYTSDPRLRTPRPWCVGYVVTEQVGGATSINETRFVSLA